MTAIQEVTRKKRNSNDISLVKDIIDEALKTSLIIQVFGLRIMRPDTFLKINIYYCAGKVLNREPRTTPGRDQQ